MARTVMSRYVAPAWSGLRPPVGSIVSYLGDYCTLRTVIHGESGDAQGYFFSCLPDNHFLHSHHPIHKESHMTIPQNPSDRTYTETHEWLKVDGDVLTIGLTTYAVDQLTDVTFAEMQPVGTEVAPGDSVGEVESVKTSSDVYSPVQGEIIEVNESLDSNPEQVNSDPFGDGWLVKIKITDQGTLGDAMDSEAYTASIS